MKKPKASRETPSTQTYSLKEVATQVGVELRVLRSWMGSPYRILRGVGRGSGARYSQHFFDRAKLTQRLRTENVTLGEIAKRLSGIPDEELEQLLAGGVGAMQQKGRGSAADYAAAALSSRGMFTSALQQRMAGHSATRSQQVPAATTSQRAGARVHWERITLSDGVEIHVRRPLNREENRLLERLFAEAQQIFGLRPGGTS
jgi:DNA-binding transcriptional MerR regulator